MQQAWISRARLKIPAATCLFAAPEVLIRITLMPDFRCLPDCNWRIVLGFWAFAWALRLERSSLADLRLF
jgi:hypothetical protein